MKTKVVLGLMAMLLLASMVGTAFAATTTVTSTNTWTQT